MCWPKILLPCPGLASIREGHACDLISKYFLTYLNFPVWELLYSVYQCRHQQNNCERLMIYSCIIPSTTLQHFHVFYFLFVNCVLEKYTRQNTITDILCSRASKISDQLHHFGSFIGGMIVVIEKVVDEQEDREVYKVGKIVTKEWTKAKSAEAGYFSSQLQK